MYFVISEDPFLQRSVQVERPLDAVREMGGREGKKVKEGGSKWVRRHK
jgi:hypothetical protein